MIVGIGSRGQEVEVIQQELCAAGHVLIIDGKFGSITEQAVKQFQAAHGLASVGFVGAKTRAALSKYYNVPRPAEKVLSTLDSAPWLSQMRAITGVKEFPGRANNPIILAWIRDIALMYPEMADYAATYTGDEIPWCGFGLAGCMARAHVRPPFGDSADQKFMYATSWSMWGTKLSSPQVGCVMVFRRHGGGHVTLLEKMDGDHVYVRGCNQSDMVNVARRSMDGFVSANWPSEWPSEGVKIAGNISNAVDAKSEA